MLKSLLLIILTVFVNTTGQFLVKSGLNRVGAVGLMDIHAILRALSSVLVIGGFVVYFISALIWISILSRSELSWAFPMLSLSYVLTALLSPVLLNEAFSVQRFIGTLVICLGVFLVYRTY
jgi:drug/metabolite transporter (DMT)-like permease